MAYEVRPETGSLFKNERKEKETQPDYRGDCLVDGKAKWISAWINTPQGGGKKYMSLKFEDKIAAVDKVAEQAHEAAQDELPVEPPPQDFPPDDIPF